jgi:putative Mg2+ transporter-C (MgtC) family protein
VATDLGPWDYIVGDWRTLMPLPWADVLLALVSIACGAIVGTERERKEKPAGLRTLVLVCLGSAVFTMVSYAFATTTNDTGRVAAQIVTGIGFLGAGVILHSRGIVTGATTAATVWVMAATGMTVGAGFAAAGLGLALLTRLALTGMFWWESHVIGEMRAAIVEVVFEPDHGKTRVKIAWVMEEFLVTEPARALETTDEGYMRLRFSFRLPRKQRRDFMNQLASMPEVREIIEREEES